MSDHENIWMAINEMREKFDTRLRRLEAAVIILIFTTASPKVGGPNIQTLVSGVIDVIGFAAATAVAVILAAAGVLAALRGN